MPVIHNDDTMICDYCLAEGKLSDIPVPHERRLGDWWVLVKAEALGDPPPAIYTSLCLCRKCEAHINEICRIHRYELNKKLNHPEPEEPLLPEEDLPDTAFSGSGGLPNPDVVCIGSPKGNGSLPAEIRTKKPSWTKKPAVKRKKKEKVVKDG